MNTKELHYSQVKQNLTIKSNSENGTYIFGYASVYNIVDQQNDLIGAFASTLTTSPKIKLLWQHDSLKPIGIIKSLTEDDYGLKVEAVINNKTATGQEVIELIRQGAVDGLSIGFNIKLSNYNNLNQRVITEARVNRSKYSNFSSQ
ncbi:MAG: HK97 family phage prohead protease [Candidatus Rickettsia vulgarisii]